jgi:hypothetical protein
MKRLLATALILGLAACGDSAPPPKPAAQPAPPQAPAPQAKAPEAKAPEAPKPDPNKELARRVKQALEGDRQIKADQIDVTAADGGRVSLWGTAPTAGERNLAAQVAAKVAGVASVDNQIKVVKGS